MSFLWSRNWIFVYYLNEFQSLRPYPDTVTKKKDVMARDLACTVTSNLHPQLPEFIATLFERVATLLLTPSPLPVNFISCSDITSKSIQNLKLKKAPYWPIQFRDSHHFVEWHYIRHNWLRSVPICGGLLRTAVANMCNRRHIWETAKTKCGPYMEP
jgi:hypothetical protein